MKAKIVILIGLLTLANLAYAQKLHNQEFNINVGAGMSTFQYNPRFGVLNAGYGGGAGIGYTYFFSSKWGIKTGLDLAIYSAKTTADRMELEYLIPTPQGLTDNFYLRAAYSNYEEKQKAMFLQLPVMVQFQTPVKRDFFYIAAGLKIGLPFSGTYESTIETLKTTGYSNFTGQQYNDMPIYGFDTYRNVKPSGDLDLGIAYLLALETGMKWTLQGKNSLYTGIYLDYGLNNISNQSTQNLLDYNSSSPKNYQYSSLLNAQSGGISLSDKVYPLSVGIKIRLGLGLGSASTLTSTSTSASKPKARRESVYIETKKPAAEKVTREEKTAKVNTVVVAKAKEEPKLTQAQRDILARSIGGYKLQETNLSESQEMLLVYRTTILKSYTTLKITIEGHAFDSESPTENRKIGQDRADKVKEYLVNNGIAADRITTVSKGDTSPIAPNDNKNKSTNNRIQIIVE
jgi:outer membrane protein OmpA-like peptidoglycan-associated protein